MAMAGFILGSIIMMNLTGAPQQADVSGYDFLKGNLALFIVSLASIYFFSSFGEEVIYRGFLITRLDELFGGDRKALVGAVLISSLIFGLAHFGWGLTGMVQTTFMGLGLALSYIVFKRNLWILVAAHAYMDSALIWPLYLG
jgi:membrane protease YdiL (CAAX protease family)